MPAEEGNRKAGSREGEDGLEEEEGEGLMQNIMQLYMCEYSNGGTEKGAEDRKRLRQEKAI